MEKKNIILYSICAVATVFLVVLAVMMQSLIRHASDLGKKVTDEKVLLFVDGDDTPDSVKAKSLLGWRFDLYGKVMPYKVRTGRYAIKNGTTSLELYRQLRNGIQEPTKLVVPSVRTTVQLAEAIGKQLMIGSEEIKAAFADTSFCKELGYDAATFPSFFIPNTYEIYWNTSLDALMERLKKEHENFWNEARKAKAKQLEMTPEEVSTLASIIDEETQNNAEKPTVAGMYINRLKKGMLLQADPTVKFALGDFALRRIYYKHLEVDNPYNTYRYAGLPPGPIRIPSIRAIDAVLNYKKSSYLYMCAKEDFSGTHNFATTLTEHMRNARKYAAALNARGIR